MSSKVTHIKTSEDITVYNCYNYYDHDYDHDGEYYTII